MKERGILFSAPMVLALLDGRKTQTRRVIPESWWRCLTPEDFGPDGDANPADYCPYGQPGDRLWVRETCIISPKRWSSDWALVAPENRRTDYDNAIRAVQYLATAPDTGAAEDFKLKKTPAIHMPRWASRLTLELTDVRVERVQDISEDDAKAEGAECPAEGLPYPEICGCFAQPDEMEHRWHFRLLWDSINGDRPGCSLAANPWVWALTFKRITT